MLWFFILALLLILILLMVLRPKPKAPTGSQLLLLPDTIKTEAFLTSIKGEMEKAVGVDIHILETENFISARYFHSLREQYQAHHLIEEMETRFLNKISGKNILLIGITDKDLYAATYDGPFVFGAYSVTNRKIAVISLARMGTGRERETRLIKMLMRYAGLKLYGFSVNQNYKNVMFETVRTTLDLDQMDIKF